MRFLSIYFVFFCSSISAFAQFQGIWLTKQKVSLSNYGYCVSFGPEGNVYVSGAFVGSYRNPGPHEMGCFLTCYNSSGMELWQKEFYSSQGAIAAYNRTDSKGNIILAGPRILRFKNTGELIDSLPSRGLSVCEGLAVDRDDNIIVAGFCYGDSIIGDIRVDGISFISKFDKNGKQLWARPCYIDLGPNQDFDLTVDSHGNIYTCGGFREAISLTKNVTITSTGLIDGYVAKYDSDFNLSWARTIEGKYLEYVTAITVDNRDNVFVTGQFGSPVAMCNDELSSPKGVGDSFVIKFDSLGNCKWMRAGRGDKGIISREITSDLNGNLFVTGYFYGSQTIRWDAFQPTTTADPVANNVFLAQLNSEGQAVSLICSIDGGGGQGRDVTCDNNGNIFLTGGFGGNFNFAGANMQGEAEMFLAKLSYEKENSVDLTSEINGSYLFSLYPNPSQGVVILSLGDNICSDATLKIFDTSGRCINQMEVGNCHDKYVSLAVSPGIYLIEMCSGSSRQTRKLIVQ